jgi:hypothetical protein
MRMSVLSCTALLLVLAAPDPAAARLPTPAGPVGGAAGGEEGAERPRVPQTPVPSQQPGAPAPPSPAPAAPPPSSSTAGEIGRVRVYLDCGLGPSGCFADYLREEITFVDFVRQPQDADVHLLSSGNDTGGGGRELVLRFVGRGRFADHDHELKAITGVSDTENIRREVVLRTVLVGLLDYVAHDGIPAGVSLRVETERPPASSGGPVRDPWNLWVFSARGNASLEADERNRERQWQLNFSADRVTADWKMSIGSSWDQVVERFDLDDDPFEVTRRDREIDGFIVKSLGPHWSAGFEAGAESSTFGNTRSSATAAAAVEYSVFPYQDYATRQLRVDYQIGIDRVRYNEVTIFNKLEETLWRQELSATLEQRQPWGSLSAEFELSQYLHDASKYRLEGGGDVNLRLTRGLSLTFSGSASRIRDQLSLPLRDATDEEVLLRIRQLQSGYEVEFSAGVTYSFGSIFNNIVNPRFGD